jgi:Phospholipid methyltransferase
MVAIKKPTTTTTVSKSALPTSLTDLVWTKSTYAHVAADFHQFHQHDLNCAIHLATTTLGVWGVFQLILLAEVLGGVGPHLIYAYAALVALTTPLATGLLHAALVWTCLQVAASDVVSFVVSNASNETLFSLVSKMEPLHVAILAVVAGYGLQDVSHYLCVEPTFMDSYLKQGKGWMLIVHSFWLLPLVIDSILMRQFFLPYLVTRNRNVICATVASRDAVVGLRDWVHQNVPSTPETTHVWPHEREATAKATVQLEKDAAIEAGFRSVFPAKHYDVKPVQGMNEIYVTAVGAKKSINSDAVFYTPHVDGPYWFLPGASLYRVLVGLTPNQMVRTRFNLQHESQDQVLDMYGVVGFDYNRELHWIDHVPDAPKNAERRSVLKLHFIVYPRGWVRYGQFCAHVNAVYNTWARGNFLTTLRPKGLYEYAMAWWIWLITWGNAAFEEVVGWDNVVYTTTAYLLGPVPFLLLTSFRHYAVYMTTFAYRQPMVAHGYLMRDAKLYKTIAMMHLGRRLWPMVEFPQDIPGLLIACLGFSLTILATARLGMVRTYFGTELGFVKPEWIHGFPYGTIPHPMIVGQLVAFSTILFWWRNQISQENAVLLMAHMACYTAHMVQEMLFSSY